MSNMNPALIMMENTINGADMLKNDTDKLNILKEAMDELRVLLIKYGIEELEGRNISFKNGILNVTNCNISIKENTSRNEDNEMNDKLNLVLRSDCLEDLSEKINDNIWEGIKDNRSLLEVDIREIYNGNDIDNAYEAKLNFVREVKDE